jgi:F-type H+-transporting ATPase subunit delta
MSAVTSRYARAFADVVLDRKLDANQTLQELRSLAGALEASEPLRKIWQTPSIPADQKRGLLDAMVAKMGVSRPVRNFLAVLIDHHRIPFLAQVVRQFELELDHRMGFTEAEITSSRELSDEEKRALEQQVEKLTGRKVRARYARDASILGGAIVRVGSTIYDGSIRGQLLKLREQLAAG